MELFRFHAIQHYSMDRFREFFMGEPGAPRFQIVLPMPVASMYIHPEQQQPRTLSGGGSTTARLSGSGATRGLAPSLSPGIQVLEASISRFR